MLIHEESLTFGITGDEISPVIKLCIEHLHGFRIEQHRKDGRRYGSLIAKSLVVVEPVNGIRVLRVSSEVGVDLSYSLRRSCAIWSICD